jgi:hypothetical protein
MSPGDSHYGGMPDAAVTLKANWYEGEGGNPYITIGGYASSTYTFSATGDTTVASINSSGDWQIIKDLAFGTTSEQHGGSGDAVTIEVQENDGDERTDTIVLSNNQGATLQVNIKQLAAPQSPNADLVVFLDNQIAGDHPFVEMTFTITEWYEDGSSSTSSSGKIEPNNGSACVSIQRPAGKWVVAALVNGHIQYSNVPGTVGLMVTSGGSGGAAYTPQNDYTFSFSADTVNGGMTMVAYYTNYAG